MYNKTEQCIACKCSIVDFDIIVKGVLKGRKVGLLVNIIEAKTNRIVGVVCKTALMTDNNPKTKDFECIDATVNFKDVVVDSDSCNENLYAKCVACNYISNFKPEKPCDCEIK